LKKFYDLSSFGAFTFIKVKFKYYYFDTWGWGGNDRAWAAFADGANGSQMRVGWSTLPAFLNSTEDMNTNEFLTANNFNGNNVSQDTDHCENAEMTAFKSGNNFWLYFGAALSEDTNNERYGVGMIEIWVK
jgi:hypothetical protein